MTTNTKYLIIHNNQLLIKELDNEIAFLDYYDLQKLKLSLHNFDTLVIKNTIKYEFSKVETLCNFFEPFKLINLRDMLGNLNDETFNIAAKAFHLVNWKDNIQYCSNCGSLVEDKSDERAKICPNCNSVYYPTISPAIITAVIKDNKLLLAHNTNFPKNLFSVIAGFLEPGETFEDCVKREVFEEIGIQVKNIRYFASQPWPFPYTLMVGFICDYESGEISVDGVEIDDAKWCSVSELPNIPFKGSISRKLIDDFVKNYK